MAPLNGRTAPETWEPARNAVARVLRPLERFLHVQAASGIVLLAVTALALFWANSRWAESYERVWNATVTLAAGPYHTMHSVRFWVNDGLMVIFFFLVGLEIRREIHEGELSEPKRAALPAAAALGGMLVPALLFLGFNQGPSRSGWGIPMATDIAFAVGVLSILGARVAPALRVLLLALAIIDDIGAIVVIALFYSSGVSLAGGLVALAGVGAVLGLQRLGVRRAIAYVPAGFVVWIGCLRAGIHPTIAGVILGLLTPARAWFGKRGFILALRHAVQRIDGDGDDDDEGRPTDDLVEPLGRVNEARREAMAPVVRLQTNLHPWVAFVIMPVFALANAGVNLEGVRFDTNEARRVLAGVVLGLIVGKPFGVLAMSFLAVRLRLAIMPAGVTWRGLALVGTVAGIGFTMAIFIADLAFAESDMLGTAKLGVLVASAIAGLAAILAGRLLLRGTIDSRAATTVGEAEGSNQA